MNEQDFLDRALDMAIKDGFCQAECYLVTGRSLEVRVFKHEISHFENSRTLGLSFRGMKDHKMGYAYSEIADPDVLMFLFREATENARILSDQEKEYLFAGEAIGTADTFSDQLAAVSAPELISAARTIESGGLEADPRIKGTEYALAEYSEGERLLANTLGLKVRQKSNLLVTFAMARAQEKDSLKQGSSIWQGRDLNQLNARQQGQLAAQIAVSHLGAKPVPSGNYPVVIENRAAVDLIRTFVPIFYADNIQKGFSLLGDKLGKIIASPVVSILDDPFVVDSFYHPLFDSEGVVCRKTSLIEKGQMTGMLHNQKTAARSQTDSTGNGFKASFKSPVAISSTNTVIQPGQKSRDSLIKTMDSGLLITDLQGLHSGCNLTSGDFSLSVEGFWVEKGHIDRPVEQITMAGNIYQLLSNVIDVGNDLWFGLPGGSGQVGSPSLQVDRLAISGQ